jgi:hypothetical protein
MPDAERLLELIEEFVVKHGGDLGGWTRRNDETLQLFAGRVTLRAKVSEPDPARVTSVHAHVFTTLHEHDDEVLDGCLMGLAEDRDTAIAQAATIWVTCVAGPIKSFIDNKPICMTCQAGVADGDVSQGYSPGDYGLPGLRAYVGPSIARGFRDDKVHTKIGDGHPWFRFAAESAAPRRVHLAKALIVSRGKQGWHRELEIDGHDVSYHDPNWPAGVAGPDFGYITRFAVFEFPRNSTEIARRADVERAVRYFAEHYSAHESIHQLEEEMVRQGFDADLVHETESISTIAFGRAFFEPHGVQFAPTIIRARRDGRVERDVPLMSIPAYTRARALAVKLRETMPQKDFQRLCLYSAESNAILKAMEAAGDKMDFSTLSMYSCVVPDRGVSDRTMKDAIAVLNDLAEQKRHDSAKSASSSQTAAPASGPQRKPARQKEPWWKFW